LEVESLGPAQVPVHGFKEPDARDVVAGDAEIREETGDLFYGKELAEKEVGGGGEDEFEGELDFFGGELFVNLGPVGIAEITVKVQVGLLIFSEELRMFLLNPFQQINCSHLLYSIQKLNKVKELKSFLIFKLNNLLKHLLDNCLAQLTTELILNNKLRQSFHTLSIDIFEVGALGLFDVGESNKQFHYFAEFYLLLMYLLR
jgi:hypothetical protein